MNVEAALSKIGAEIISAEKLNETTFRYMIRAGKEPNHVKAWNNAVAEYLLHADELRQKSNPPAWTVDLSRYYFVQNHVKVKYMWRLIISGNVDLGVSSLSAAIIRGMGSAVELKSFPIINPLSDPKEGSYRGAHPLGAGETVVAREFVK